MGIQPDSSIHSKKHKYHISDSAVVTIQGSDGKSVQVSQAVVAQAQLGIVQPGPDGMITVPGTDGKPVKIPPATLAKASAPVPPVVAGGNTGHLFTKKPT